MSEMEESIRISPENLATLLRRAELHDDADADCVTVTGKEYASMQLALRQFQALRTALLAGGVAQDAIETLINSVLSPVTDLEDCPKTEPGSSEKPRWSADAPVFVPKQEQFSFGPNRAALAKPWRHTTNIPPTPPSNSQEQSRTEKDGQETGYCEEAEEEYENNHDDRSVVLHGLSPITTLADIVKVVRGGVVLNMFIRARERSAHVAFVDPLIAVKFVMHCKRNDLYIKGKRVEVYWDERQHYMPGHIARRVYNNHATRNLVIRFPKPDTTPDSIREDLEHIHNLEVVSCEMKNGHAFISTNGITFAVTARTCMQSRVKYKHSRIDFYPDECDQPLPQIIPKQSSQRAQSPNKCEVDAISHINRFMPLADGDENRFDDAPQAALRRNIPAGGGVARLAIVPAA